MNISDIKANLWKDFKKAILKKSVLSVFVLVTLWNISVATDLTAGLLEGKGALRETAREARDLNLHIQMRFYQLLTSMKAVRLKPANIRLVYIDDVAHWTYLHGNIPTSRSFLADLVTVASTPPHAASVIGIDMELLAPLGSEDGDDDDSRQNEKDNSRKDDDKALLKAIQDAAGRGVPVVLASAYYLDHGRGIQLPNVIRESELRPAKDGGCGLARCPGFGFVNLPSDRRQIPLEEVSVGGEQATKQSFALALASLSTDADSLRSDLGLPEGKHLDEETFGSFLPEERYTPVMALNLIADDNQALNTIAGKIVLIGGHWHDIQGRGALVDNHLSPAGNMSGLGLHANYLASLLQHQYAREVPLWIGILFDILVGMAIYMGFEYGEGRRKLFFLLLAFPLPFAGAYFSLLLINRYLDFLLPVELYFLHVAYSMAEPRVVKRWKALQLRRPATAGGSSGHSG